MRPDMRKSWLILPAAVVVVFSAFPGPSYAGEKTGVVNIQAVLEGYDKMRFYMTMMEKADSRNKKEIELLEMKLRYRGEELELLNPKSELYREKQKALDEIEKRIEKLKEDFHRKLGDALWLFLQECNEDVFRSADVAKKEKRYDRLILYGHYRELCGGRKPVPPKGTDETPYVTSHLNAWYAKQGSHF
ncbi:MAG: OmpH/Skp family outer membrane protein [Planctomycetota bacterium]|jgi:hypothetical protein